MTTSRDINKEIQIRKSSSISTADKDLLGGAAVLTAGGGVAIAIASLGFPPLAACAVVGGLLALGRAIR